MWLFKFIFPCGFHTACINTEHAISNLTVLLWLYFRLQPPQTTSEWKHNGKNGLFPLDDKAMKYKEQKSNFFEALTFYMTHESSAINVQELLWRWYHSQAEWCNGEDLKVLALLKLHFLNNCCFLNFKYILSFLKDWKLFCWPKLCIFLVSKKCWLRTSVSVLNGFNKIWVSTE